MIKALNAAIECPVNRYEDGSINWNFVDADMWMDFEEEITADKVAYYEAFNEIADRIEAA